MLPCCNQEAPLHTLSSQTPPQPEEGLLFWSLEGTVVVGAANRDLVNSLGCLNAMRTFDLHVNYLHLNTVLILPHLDLTKC